MEGGKNPQVVVLLGEEGRLITRQRGGGKSLAPGEEVQHEAYLALLTGHFLTLKRWSGDLQKPGAHFRESSSRKLKIVGMKIHI